MITLTIGNWILIAICALVGLPLGIYLACDNYDRKPGIIVIIVTAVICVGLIFGLSWYHNNTASGQRDMKDYSSNLNGGLNREITITAEDGREIFHYEGRVDIETAHEGNANYILFESETGQRYIIYYGIQDTVLIVEKGGE